MTTSKKGKIKVLKKQPGKLAKIAKDVNPLEVLRNISNEVTKYKIVREQERTKRDEIKAQRAVILETLKSKRKIFLTYLEYSFDERKKNFKEFFKRLDEAIKNDDIQQMGLILQAILQLAESSPFKDLMDTEKVLRMLKNKENPIDF